MGSQQPRRPNDLAILAFLPLAAAAGDRPVRYYAAACQTDMPNSRTRDEIPRQVDHMLAMIDRAVLGYAPFFPVRLLVFPEFGHSAPIYPTVEELLDRLAVSIPNEHTERYHHKARQHGVYIQTGTFLECDPRYPGHVFNTTCLIGPDGLLTKYRKVHTWIPWEVHASPHDLLDPSIPVPVPVPLPVPDRGTASETRTGTGKGTGYDEDI